MTPEDIAFLFAYNRWANARTMQAAARLSPEALTRDLGNSFRSVRDTLVHIYGAEWIWLARWTGSSPASGPVGSDYPDLAALSGPWKDLEREQQAFVAGLTADRLAAPVEYANLKGERFSNPLGRLMQHQVNHSTYHRGQITTMLRQLGVPPVGTDLVTFLRA
jgi:uncharacterized damage-inducible protein DinB